MKNEKRLEKQEVVSEFKGNEKCVTQTHKTELKSTYDKEWFISNEVREVVKNYAIDKFS